MLEPSPPSIGRGVIDVDMIKIKEICAWNDDVLAEQLNVLGGRIVSAERTHDDFYKVIYEV